MHGVGSPHNTTHLMFYAGRVTNTGGFDGNNRYNGPEGHTYGEIPPLPRDGYGISESGQPTYSAPTENVPNSQVVFGNPPVPPQMSPTQYGPPAQYAPPAQYGPPGVYSPNPYPYAQTSGTNGLAIASLAVTLVGGFLACGVGFILGPILGMVSLGQIKQSGEQGRGLAIASIVLGVIGILVIIAYMLFFVYAIRDAATSPYDY